VDGKKRAAQQEEPKGEAAPLHRGPVSSRRFKGERNELEIEVHKLCVTLLANPE